MKKEEAYKRIIQRYGYHMPKVVADLFRDENDEEAEFIAPRICEELFIRNDIDGIRDCIILIETIEESDESAEFFLKDLKTFLKALQESRKLKKYETKEIKKAETLKSVYAFEKATTVYEGLLNNRIERKYEVQIRKSLVEIYDEFDEPEKSHDNMRRLLELGVKDEELIREYIYNVIINDYPESELSVIKRVLKGKNSESYWRFLAEKPFLLDEKLLVVYEYVKPPVEVLGIEIIEGIVSQYCKSQSYKKAEKMLINCRNSEIWNANLSYYEAMLLLQKNLDKEAEAVVDFELKNNPQNPNINIGKGHILFERGQAFEALSYYKKAFDLGEDIRTIRNIVLCQLKINKEEDAIQMLLEWVNRTKNTYGYFMVYLWVLYEELPKCFISKLLGLLRYEKEYLDGYVDQHYIAMDHIIRITDEEGDKGIIRFNLIHLFACFERIKSYLKYREHDKAVYHYSNLKSLNGLLTTNRSERHFRLYNVAYMNDPAEGNVIYDVIEKCNQLELSEVMKLFREDEVTLYCNNYIGSFSKKPDFLPMWIHYSEGGTGVCYSIKANIFDYYDAFDHETVFGKDEHLRSQRIEHKGFVLRNVCYCRNNSVVGNKDIQEQCNIISDLLVELKKDIQKNEEIKLFIKNCIEDVRYLFKDGAYESEEELRVIVKDLDEERKIEYRGADSIPHLYLEMGNQIEFEEVVIGPKVPNVAELAAYLNVCTNVERVSKSTINYR